MFKEINYIYRKLNITADALITVFAYIITRRLASFVYTNSWAIPDFVQRYDWLAIVVAILWPILLNVNGLYPTNRLRTFKDTVWIIVYSTLQGVILIFAAFFMFKFHFMSRLLIFDFAGIVAILLVAKEGAVRWYVRSIRKRGANLRNALIVGTPESAGYLVKKIDDNRGFGLRIVGLLVPGADSGEKEMLGHPVLGSFEQIEDVLHQHTVDNVIITSYIAGNYEEIENIISRCEEEGIEVWLPARIFHTKVAKPDSDELLNIPMFVFRTEPKFTWEILIKIVIDRVAGLVLSIVTLPIVLLAAALIKLTSPGPVIFKQVRCGYHGRQFTVYKLRTMFVGAEKMIDDLKARNIMQGPLFKMDRDPRITPIGWFLRKTSIDELPQFWNVLMGEMSLVGPRPPLPQEVDQYKGWQRRRLSMKPGITGLLQVSGRSDIIDFDHWTDHDLDYIDDWSLWLDIKIILKTIFVVLSTKGAK